jgi:hypothetical protein
MAHNYLLSDDEFVLIESEPIAIMRCDVCGSRPEVYDDEVVCACGRRMPVTENATTAQIIETWNRMVERANRSNSE